jgi:hypothetical protein
MHMKMALAMGCLAVGLALPAVLRADSCATAGNLVQNCSFGTGDFTGWTVTNAASGSDLGVNYGSYSGYNGDSVASFGATGNEYDTISQTLSTTPGVDYTLSFWLQDEQGDGPNSDTDFQALWNGTSLLDQYTTTGLLQYTFTVAGTGSDTLTFEGYNSPAWYDLSDVSVTPTPEPSSFLLMGSGVLGLAAFLRRRFV